MKKWQKVEIQGAVRKTTGCAVRALYGFSLKPLEFQLFVGVCSDTHFFKGTFPASPPGASPPLSD